MSNGRIDDAGIEAILSGGQDEVNRYLVTAVYELQKAMEGQKSVRGFLAGCRVNAVAIIAAGASIVAIVTAIAS